MAFVSTPESIAEWYDTDAVPQSEFTVPMPEPNEDYAYAAARLFSWFPVVNSKGATYFRDDFTPDLLDTLRGKQANLEHDRGRVVGTIKDYLVNDEGVDVVVEIDRRCANAQGLELSDLQSGHYFSHVSVELTRALDNCFYLAIDEGFNIQQKIPVKTGDSIGMRRTTNSDPYLLQGHRVVERIRPARFTGLGLVPNPADTTATMYALAASEDAPDMELNPVKHEINVYANDHVDMSRDSLTPGHHFADPGWQEDGKKRYQLDDAKHVASAAKFFGREENRDKYSPEHRKEIDATIAAAKKKFGVGDEKPKSESASADTQKEFTNMTEAEYQAKIQTLEAEITELKKHETASADLEASKGEVTRLTEELASANGELTTVKAELDKMKEAEKARETAAAIEAFVAKAHEAKPFASDEERDTFAREEAAHAIDNVGRMEHVLLKRENEHLKEKLASHAAPPAEDPKPAEGEPKTGDEMILDPAAKKTAEEASDPEFKSNTPKVGVAPTFEGNAPTKELTALY